MHTAKTRNWGSRGAALAATLLVGALWSQPAQAYVITTDAGTGIATQGWDGAGQNAVTISWFLGRIVGGVNVGLPDDVTEAAARSAITAAMASWSAVAQITFVEIFQPFQNDSIDIYWASGDHGDGNNFDGPWNPSSPSFNVFAHAYPPDDIEQLTNGPVAAGNIHLDEDETWVTSGATIGTNAGNTTLDIQSIILHELGHSLGLGHSNVGGATMAAIYNGEDRTLSADDIAGIRSLYACAGSDCPTTPPDEEEPPTGVPEPGTLSLLGLAFAFGASKSRFRK